MRTGLTGCVCVNNDMLHVHVLKGSAACTSVNLYICKQGAAVCLCVNLSLWICMFLTILKCISVPDMLQFFELLHKKLCRTVLIAMF